MAKPNPIITLSYLLAAAILLTFMPIRTGALMPYTKSLWEMMLPPDDPFRILEQSPMTIPRDTETLALARADWKETATAHAIVIDIPGIKKEDVKIEVEENRVLRISGERKAEQEAEGEKWHRAERARGRFFRQFRLPSNADLDRVEAHLEDGVLGITVPKFAEERRRQPKVIRIEESGRSGEDIRAVRAEMFKSPSFCFVQWCLGSERGKMGLQEWFHFGYSDAQGCNLFAISRDVRDVVRS